MKNVLLTDKDYERARSRIAAIMNASAKMDDSLPPQGALTVGELKVLLEVARDIGFHHGARVSQW